MDNNINDSYINNLYDISFKIVLLGDSGVGKSSIIYRYINEEFNEDHQPTLGVAFSSKILEKNKKKVKLEIWDTAGQERFKNIAPMYYRKASAIIIVFDIFNRNSFEECKYWVQETEDNGNPHCLKFLIGNKIDLLDYNERIVTFEEAEGFAMKNSLFYMEVSAKRDVNIAKLFRRIVRFLSKRYNEHSESIKRNNILTLNHSKTKKICCL